MTSGPISAATFWFRRLPELRGLTVLSTDSSTVRNEVGDFLKKNGSSVALAFDWRAVLATFKKLAGV